MRLGHGDTQVRCAGAMLKCAAQAQCPAVDSSGQQGTADSSGQQWTAVDSGGQRWTAVDSAPRVTGHLVPHEAQTARVDLGDASRQGPYGTGAIGAG